jgi:hypothetical protein
MATDGLSRRLPAPEDPPETDDFEEWIDDSYGFFMELANWQPPHLFPSALTMHPLFTEMIRSSIAATSAFITEETSDDESNDILPANEPVQPTSTSPKWENTYNS